jgi:hypothetical protein
MPAMTDADDMLGFFRRYERLLRAALPATLPFQSTSESATAVQVERGLVFPAAMRAVDASLSPYVDRLLELSGSDRLPGLAVIDGGAHHRPVYRPLLVYSWLQAFRIVYETLPRSEFGRWEEGLRPWCDLLEAELAEVEWLPGSMPAALGASAGESAWIALALHVAGKVYVRDAWTDLASHTFGKLIRSQQPGGSFLEPAASDNPETHGYHELVLLHAAASYAVQAEDRTLAAAVARNAEFHLRQMQPDHATSQPWAMFGFIWSPATRPLADQLLHSSSMNHPQGLDGVSLMLLSDALYCLELFTR